MTAWVFAVGRMLGLGSVAGIRASMTLAVIGIVSRLGWGVGLNPTFSFLSHWLAIVVFVVLALLESSFDKIPKLDRLQSRLMMPYRLVVGAVVGAATIPFGWQGVVVGAVVGAGAAWTSTYVKGLTRPKTVPSDAVLTLMSLWEDLAVFAGVLLTLIVSPVGYGIVAFTGFMYWGVGLRRRAKYRAMRRRRA
ncbi:MAG: DUF4126 domain-containing protein [Actinobacteria bacterium]|nr:DUF4126 domain-containing protein [Actinomycetota bacterium]